MKKLILSVFVLALSACALIAETPRAAFVAADVPAISAEIVRSTKNHPLAKFEVAEQTAQSVRVRELVELVNAVSVVETTYHFTPREGGTTVSSESIATIVERDAAGKETRRKQNVGTSPNLPDPDALARRFAK